jgi:hypothetical protein
MIKKIIIKLVSYFSDDKEFRKEINKRLITGILKQYYEENSYSALRIGVGELILSSNVSDRLASSVLIKSIEDEILFLRKEGKYENK